MNPRVVLPAAACAALLLVGCQRPEAAAPAAPQTGAAAAEGFDHSAFDAVLRAHVRDGKVDYEALKAQHRDELAAYLQSVAGADPSGFVGPNDEQAFWLNAYNAFVIAGVLERYPDIESMMDVKDFFKEQRWRAGGRAYSLDQIENEIIRPKFEDPRIHFILVCAAQSCPPLQAQAMNPRTLQADLESATREAINNTKYVEIDQDAGVLRLTRILSWYKHDFVDAYGSLEAFLMRYLEEPRKSQLKQGGYTIEFMEYDWALNDAGGSPTR